MHYGQRTLSSLSVFIPVLWPMTPFAKMQMKVSCLGFKSIYPAPVPSGGRYTIILL